MFYEEGSDEPQAASITQASSATVRQQRLKERENAEAEKRKQRLQSMGGMAPAQRTMNSGFGSQPKGPLKPSGFGSGPTRAVSSGGFAPPQAQPAPLSPPPVINHSRITNERAQSVKSPPSAPSPMSVAKHSPLEAQDFDENQIGDTEELVTQDYNLSDVRRFCTTPGPNTGPVECKITRVKGSVGKMYPVYNMELEKGSRFLMAARKRKMKSSANYVISLHKEDLQRHSGNFLGKLRSNFVGTEFSIFDSGEAEKKAATDNVSTRKEMAAVIYERNILGFGGPRKMQVLLPALDSQGRMLDAEDTKLNPSLSERYKKKETSKMFVLKTKEPVWNQETKSFVLNFNGRVTEASVKNFQLVEESDPSRVLVQFGRTGDNTFTLDYSHPVSAIQAFGIALSSFDSKLLCD